MNHIDEINKNEIENDFIETFMNEIEELNISQIEIKYFISERINQYSLFNQEIRNEMIEDIYIFIGQSLF